MSTPEVELWDRKDVSAVYRTAQVISGIMKGWKTLLKQHFVFSLSYSNMKGSEAEQIRADTSDLPWSPRMTLLEFCIRFVLGRAVEAILSSILAVVFGGYERSNVEQRFFFCTTSFRPSWAGAIWDCSKYHAIVSLHNTTRWVFPCCTEMILSITWKSPLVEFPETYWFSSN